MKRWEIYTIVIVVVVLVGAGLWAAIIDESNYGKWGDPVKTPSEVWPNRMIQYRTNSATGMVQSRVVFDD